MVASITRAIRRVMWYNIIRVMAHSTSKVLMRLISFVGLLLVFGFLTQAQEIPKTAKDSLDIRFPGWNIRPNHIPNPCDQYGSPAPSFRALAECNLNDDGVPDYSLAITTGHDSTLNEYFLALVSTGSTYGVFVLTSSAAFHGVGERYFYIIHAGDTASCFCPDDSVIQNYGHAIISQDQITFPTDAIQINPACGANWKEVEADGYVFIRGQFLSYSAAD